MSWITKSIISSILADLWFKRISQVTTNKVHWKIDAMKNSYKFQLKVKELLENSPFVVDSMIKKRNGC